MANSNATIGSTSLTRADRMSEVSAPGWVDDVFKQLKSRTPRLLINNEWVAAKSSRTAETFDPSTGDVVATYAIANKADVDAAVGAAYKAQPDWAALTITERGQYLFRLRDVIAANASLLSTVDAINAGLPVERMFNDLDNILRVLHAWPALATSLRGEVLEGTPGLHYTRYSPYGVVARIVAYNHPILFAVKGSLAALMAGNTIVLKPADQTPLSALVLGDLVRQVFPPGVFNIVTGDGATGSALVSHRLVRRVAFTGSVRTGRLIQETAARSKVSNISLELGGKNAMIVFRDANAKDAARSAIFGMNLRANGGQSCGSTSRVFVHRDIHDEFVAELTAGLSSLTLGSAYDPDVDMGPVISEAAATRIREHIRTAVEDGATLVTGGLSDERLPKKGNFVAPTLFSNVPATSRIANEEIFGPVIALAEWNDYETVMDAVNSVDYGLTASIWTNDITTALKTAERIEAGYVWINESTTHYFGMPFGGWKDSGTGREECMEELQSFLQLKSVHVKLN